MTAPHMGQTMAECNCPYRQECLAAKRCLSQHSLDATLDRIDRMHGLMIEEANRRNPRLWESPVTYGHMIIYGCLAFSIGVLEAAGVERWLGWVLMLPFWAFVGCYITKSRNKA